MKSVATVDEDDPPAGASPVAAPPAREQPSLARSSAILTIGSILARASMLASTILIARRFSPEGFALVLLAQAVTQYLAIAFDLGLTLAAVREGAQRPALMGEILYAVTAIRVPVVLAGIVVLAACAALVGLSGEATAVLVAFALAVGVTALDVSWVGQALNQPTLRSIVVAGSAIAGFVLLVPALAITTNPIVVPFAQLVGATVFVGIGATVTLRRYARPARPGMVVVRGIIALSIPLAAASLLAQVYYTVDLLLLGAWRTPYEVAAYGAAGKIILGLMMVSWMIAMAALPRLTTAAHTGLPAVAIQATDAIRVGSLVAIPAAIGGTLLAGPLISTLFGDRYADGALPFAILVWSVPIAAVRILLLYSFTALGRPWAVPRSSVFGAVVDVGLNLFLIPRFGMVGAAVATVAAEAAVAVAAAWQGRDLVAAMHPRVPWRVLGSAAIMTLGLLLVRDAPLWISLPIGAACWFVPVIATGLADVGSIQLGVRRFIGRLAR